jgi:hypothetical protein
MRQLQGRQPTQHARARNDGVQCVDAPFQAWAAQRLRGLRVEVAGIARSRRRVSTAGEIPRRCLVLLRNLRPAAAVVAGVARSGGTRQRSASTVVPCTVTSTAANNMRRCERARRPSSQRYGHTHVRRHRNHGSEGNMRVQSNTTPTTSPTHRVCTRGSRLRLTVRRS